MSRNEGKPYDIMDETAALVGVLKTGADFLKPGICDHAVVLLATGLIEKILKLSLIAGFRQDVISKTMVANVFEGKGPLATFSAKIEVCAGLGNIVGNVRHDLKIINGVRNDFAHSPFELHLKDYSACLSLKMDSNIAAEEGERRERYMFKRSCAGVISSTCKGTLLMTARHRFLAANAEGVVKEYEAMVKEIESSEPSE